MSKRITDATCIKALRAYEKHGSQNKAAKALQVARSTFDHWYRQAKERFPDGISDKDNGIVFPELPSSELSAEELIKQACARFETHKAARDARRWMEIKIKTNKPIGICFMGDPHVDNAGCNWPLLNRDIAILEQTEGLYAVNIGDLTDNWIGRLMRLYADQEMSKKQAWKLAKYLLKDCKIKWLCHILGNHDLWGDAAYLIKANAHPMVPVEDWQSRFQIVFPNDVRTRVFVAHDFPGTSIWNKLHGPQRASMIGEEAEIYACGHKHEWAHATSENPQRNFIYHLIRARGYKFIDQHADQLGYGSQKHGASIVAIIDPLVDGPGRVTVLPDLKQAAEFLNWKRSQK